MKDERVLMTASLSKEMKLLLALLAADHGCVNATENDEALYREVDWGQFLSLARHHRVFPQLYGTLKRQRSDFIPDYVMQLLKRDYRQNTIRMLHLAAEMETIGHILESNGIRSLFLKGPALAQQLYGDISLRTSGDIDLLVPLEDLRTAERVLQENGYEKEEFLETLLGDWKWRRHHVNYVHPEKKTKVEVHWRLHPGPAKTPSFDELWERRGLCEITSYPLYRLGTEDLFIFLVAHGARHGWSRLRWLADIDQLSKKEMAWDVVIRRAGTYWQLQLVGQALLLASELLRTRLNARAVAIANAESTYRLAQGAMYYLENPVNLHTTPLPDEVAAYHKRYLFSLMGLRQRALFTLSFLYPYPSDAKVLPLPKPLHFLYFPLRPVLWAWKRSRRPA